MNALAEPTEGSNEIDLDLPSCDGCRRRKLRCSREWPTCSHCRRLASGCTYEYQRKKPGLKGGAVEALSRRVEKLESAVFDSRHGPMPVPSPAGQPENLHSQALDGILSLLTQEIHRLNSNLTTPSTRTGIVATPSATSTHGSTHEEGPDSGIERRRKRTRLNSFAQINAAEDYDFAHQTALTRFDVVAELLDTYFETIHPWVPILHETRFRQRLADSKHRDRSFVILHAILVAALRLVDDTRFCAPIVDIHLEEKRSRHYVLFNGMSDLSLENLQALVIIAFTDIGQGETNKAWSTIGSLARTVQYLHLSVEDTDFAEPAALLWNLPRLTPPEDWIEEEERRRLFWNVFLLDRFCSITTGWNVSLTADDVCRRLPIDGGLWKRNQPALTPYLGIWDHSEAKIGHTITFLPSKYEIPGRATEPAAAAGSGATNESGPNQGNTAASVERLKIGAFAYYVESVESLSRINTYFVQQKIDFTSRQDVFSWLTRFKELDLRLVHRKMFLPQKWKNPSDNPIPTATTAMDPNMTLAHLTHNMSSILLHQRIAYPSKELKHLKLPNACSADTCYVAATETANITTKYLDHAATRRVLAPHFAICVFVSAKVLLVHSLHYEVELASEFWTLVESLETISSKWKGSSVESRNESVPLAGSLAMQLRQLHDLCETDVANHPLAHFGKVPQGVGNGASAMQAAETPMRFHRGVDQRGNHGDVPSVPRDPAAGDGTTYWEPIISTGQGDEASQREKHPSTTKVNEDNDQSPCMGGHLQAPAIEAAAVDELSLISQGLMDQSFLEMNRIISFDDFMFITDSGEFSDMTGL